jgi:predicted transcriptional regulator of viral defense system
MKKQNLSRFAVIAYFVLPAAAVGLQAYLTDRVITVSHVIEQQYAATATATHQQAFAKPAPDRAVRL